MRAKILVVMGTRPEAIKLAPVIRALAAHADRAQTIVCATAQHRRLLDQVCEAFSLRIDIDLNLMQPNQSLAAFAARALSALDDVIARLAPSLVLAQGDTTTVLAAAQAAYYQRVRFGHVEAGLRTGDKWSPFPEEFHRGAVGLLADLHFAPTEWARDNLMRAGVRADTIHVVGNPVIDAVRHAAALPCSLHRLPLPADALQAPRLLLTTLHRRENQGAPMRAVCAALRALLAGDPQLHAVLPLHPNPAARDLLETELRGVQRMHLIPPPDYPAFISLLKRATLVLTDSGGLQEEAPALGKPVLVLRDTTERPEGIAAGTALLVGTDTDAVIAQTRRLLSDRAAYQAMAQAPNPYGDGRAGERIAALCLDALRAWGQLS